MAANLVLLFHHLLDPTEDNLDTKVDNLYSADDGKSSQQSHSSSDSRQLRHKVCLFIFGDPVKCWGGKIDSDPVEI